ncbi:phytanoyl-CoA dioxygenase family protein [Nonomuraea wenchangensis]|uniref:phytanoyl-CoA dioxygenase family protein n=1 Tax=Nonomuraea wenchangensis TaxID=568860 RepID=UPI003788495A
MESNMLRFRRAGHLVIPGLLTRQQIERLRAAVDRLRSQVESTPAAFKVRYTERNGADFDTWGVEHVFALPAYQDEFGEILEDGRIVQHGREALDDDRLRFWRAHVYWEPRRVGYSLYWHRDYGEHDHYHPEGVPTHAHFNLCLWDDSSLRIVPGSHRRPLTLAEDALRRAKSADPIENEQVIRCKAGDMLIMNAHLLHRAACSAGTPRGVIHIELQAYREPTGGHGSWRYMREPGFLSRMPPTVRELMRNAIEWDDAHPLSLRELTHGRRLSREFEQHEARERS